MAHEEKEKWNGMVGTCSDPEVLMLELRGRPARRPGGKVNFRSHWRVRMSHIGPPIDMRVKKRKVMIETKVIPCMKVGIPSKQDKAYHTIHTTTVSICGQI